MPRIPAVEPVRAPAKARELLEGVNRSLGLTPNMMKAMAQSPAALGGFLAFSRALAGGFLESDLREQIALGVAGVNRCNYCASAHTALATQLGLPAAETQANLRGRSGDPRVQAALDLATAIVEKRGLVSDQDLDDARAAGFSEGEIVEITANVALNILTNYFNHVAQPEVDFPLVDAGEAIAAA